MADSSIEQWRAAVEPGTPMSMDFVDIPLDERVPSLEATVESLNVHGSTTDHSKNSVDVFRACFIPRRKDSCLNRQHKVQPELFSQLETPESFHHIGGYASTAGVEHPNTGPISHVLSPPVDGNRSATLAEESRIAESEVQDLPGLSGQPSSTLLEDTKSETQQIHIFVDSFQGQVLGEGGLGRVVCEGNRPNKPSTSEQARPQLPHVANRHSLGRECSLLNGRPFDLGSADSTSTRSSLRDPALEARVMSLQDTRKRPSATAAGPYAHTGSSPDSYGGMTDVPIPVFPYAHQTTHCKERDCPVWIQHEKGPYLHEGKLRTREGKIFGASNPPPRIWQAYDRIKGGKSVPEKDVSLVNSFVRYHFGFSDEGDLEERGSPVKSSSGYSSLLSRAGGLIGALQRLRAFRRR
ncbi:MAG: hypothetical protein Q9217_002756 [Psora testacea]